MRGYLKKQKTAFGNIAGSGLEVAYEQTDHRTCVRMSVEEYSRLMERSKAAGLPANAWLMEQLTDNRPIISRDGVMSDFLCLLNQKGREINAVARAFNSGYGTAEELRQALDCLKDIAQAAYEIRKEGFTHAP